MNDEIADRIIETFDRYRAIGKDIDDLFKDLVNRIDDDMVINTPLPNIYKKISKEAAQLQAGFMVLAALADMEDDESDITSN